MKRIGKLLGIGCAAALAVAVGCTSKDQNSAGNDGTQEVQSSQASALVTGKLEASINGNIRIRVNNAARVIKIAEDRTFVLREVPSGEVKLDVDVDDVDVSVTGTIVIHDVQPGEVIDVSIRREGNAIVIVIVTRNPSGQPPREVTQPTGDAIVIDGNNVCYVLRPMTYSRSIVINGNHVSLVGSGSCNGDDRTVLTGALTIRGDDAIVFDVDLRGPVTITGNRARVQNTCGGECFAQQCFASGNSGGGCTTATSCQGSSTVPPPGTPPPPPPPPPPSNDGGTTTDAGGGGTDAGATDAGGDGAVGP